MYTYEILCRYTVGRFGVLLVKNPELGAFAVQLVKEDGAVVHQAIPGYQACAAAALSAANAFAVAQGIPTATVTAEVPS